MRSRLDVLESRNFRFAVCSGEVWIGSIQPMLPFVLGQALSPRSEDIRRNSAKRKQLQMIGAFAGWRHGSGSGHLP